MKKTNFLTIGLACSLVVVSCAPSSGPSSLKPSEQSNTQTQITPKMDALPAFSQQGNSDIVTNTETDLIKESQQQLNSLSELDDITDGIPKAGTSSAGLDPSNLPEALDAELDGSSLLARPASAGTKFVDVKNDRLLFKMPTAWTLKNQNNILNVVKDPVWAYVLNSEQPNNLSLADYTKTIWLNSIQKATSKGNNAQKSALAKTKSGVDYGSFWSWDVYDGQTWIYTQVFAFNVDGKYQAVVYKARYDGTNKWKDFFTDFVNGMENIQLVKPEQGVVAAQPSPPANNSIPVLPFNGPSTKVNYFNSLLEFPTSWKAAGGPAYTVNFRGQDNVIEFAPVKDRYIYVKSEIAGANKFKNYLEFFTQVNHPRSQNSENLKQKYYLTGKLSTGQTFHNTLYAGGGQLRYGYLVDYGNNFVMMFRMEFNVTSNTEGYIVQLEQDVKRFEQEIFTTASKVQWTNKASRSESSEQWLIARRSFVHSTSGEDNALKVESNRFTFDFFPNGEADPFFEKKCYYKTVPPLPCGYDLDNSSTPFQVFNDGNGRWYLMLIYGGNGIAYHHVQVSNTGKLSISGYPED